MTEIPVTVLDMLWAAMNVREIEAILKEHGIRRYELIRFIQNEFSDEIRYIGCYDDDIGAELFTDEVFNRVHNWKVKTDEPWFVREVVIASAIAQYLWPYSYLFQDVMSEECSQWCSEGDEFVRSDGHHAVYGGGPRYNEGYD